MLPGVWLNEAGQSAAGAAMDHLITLHPAYPEVVRQAVSAGKSAMGWLSSRVKAQVATLSDAAELARGLHVVPEFLGNRAPFADPQARGCIVGLDMDGSIDGLMALYVAGVCGLAYGLRQIIDAQSAEGIATDRVVISGGAGQDPLVRQILADAIQLDVVAPKCEEPVLLGSAILAAVAAGAYPNLSEAMRCMSAFGERYAPVSGQTARLHAQRYEAFVRLQALSREIRSEEKPGI
jgi:ribulose kinase